MLEVKRESGRKKTRRGVTSCQAELTKVKAGKILRRKLDLMLENDEVDLDIVIGPVLTKALQYYGITRLPDLQDQDPEKLYQRTIAHRGKHVDRCVLYTYRCGRYVARTPAKQRVENLLLWYNWTDSKMPANAEEMLSCSIERLSQSVMNKRAADARRAGRGSDGPNKRTQAKMKLEVGDIKREESGDD